MTSLYNTNHRFYNTNSKIANVGEFIIVEFYSIRTFRWFNIKLFFKIRFTFPINKSL